MKRILSNIAFLTAIPLTALLLALVASGCMTPDRYELFEIHDPVDRMIIDSGAGDIELVTREGATSITVDATVYGEDTVIERSTTDGQLRLRTDCDEQDWGCAVDYRIEAPPGIDVDLESGAGDIVIDGLAGNARLDTGAGDIDLNCLFAASLTLISSAGDITGHNVSTVELESETGAGDIELQLTQAPNRIDCETGAGDIELDLPSSSYAMTVSTGAGDVAIDGVVDDANAQRTLRARSGAGDIEINGQAE